MPAGPRWRCFSWYHAALPRQISTSARRGRRAQGMPPASTRWAATPAPARPARRVSTGILVGMVLIPITPRPWWNHGTQTGQRGEEGELAELCTQALAVLNRRDQSPAAPRAARLQISLICWEGKLFPCNFSLRKKPTQSYPIKVQMHRWRLGGGQNQILLSDGCGGVGVMGFCSCSNAAGWDFTRAKGSSWAFS